jgi:hypothetical protein
MRYHKAGSVKTGSDKAQHIFFDTQCISLLRNTYRKWCELIFTYYLK